MPQYAKRAKKIYLICSVRSAGPLQTLAADRLVAAIEKDGDIVHYPPRDVDQNDPTGVDICLKHLKAMREADEVYVLWNPESKGSHFDLGMAFALKKPVVLVGICGEDIKNKSYIKVMEHWPF